MDFERFSVLVRREWAKVFCETDGRYSFSVDECLQVFRLFFDAYRVFACEDHPPLKANQIRKILKTMPYLETCLDGKIILDIEDYALIVKEYFKTNYPDCDYRIGHFMSGRIRELKYYEAR